MVVESPWKDVLIGVVVEKGMETMAETQHGSEENRLVDPELAPEVKVAFHWQRMESDGQVGDVFYAGHRSMLPARVVLAVLAAAVVVAGLWERSSAGLELI